ncbi:unnamed protein product [Rotaria magnacalcarata]
MLYDLYDRLCNNQSKPSKTPLYVLVSTLTIVQYHSNINKFLVARATINCSSRFLPQQIPFNSIQSKWTQM